MSYIVRINGLFGVANYLLEAHGDYYPVGLKKSATKYGTKGTAELAAIRAGYRGKGYTVLKVR